MSDSQQSAILNKILNPQSKSFVMKNGIKPGLKILSLAFDSDAMSFWLANKVLPGGSVIGIDVNPEKIALSQKKVKEYHRQNLEFKIMSVYDLAEFGENFDIIYNRFLLINLTSPKAAIKAMYACLKPGGKLLTETAIYSHSYSDPSSESFDMAIKLFKQLLSSQGKDYDAGKHIYNYLRDLNFKDIHCQLYQPLLWNEEQKVIVANEVKRAQSVFKDSGIADENTIAGLIQNLRIQAKNNGIWALANICQASAMK